MNLKKNVFGIGLCAIALAVSASAVAAGKTIRFGSDATYPPFESTSPSGDIVGFDIDLAKAMCEKMQATCTFQNQGWDGIIPALRAKKFDVIASSMSITPEREKAVLFTQKIWTTPNMFVAKKGATYQSTAEGLKGVDLGVQQGTIQDKYATKYFKDTNIKRYKTLEDAYNDLTTGRVAVVFADGGVTTEFVESPGGKNFQLVGDPIPASADEEIFGKGTGFAVRKNDTELKDALNKAFDEIRKDGTYQKIADKYFKYDIYGG